VISDTHVPERAQRIPEKFTSLLKKEDFVFHAGDFTSVQTLKIIENFCTVFAVHGNMDDPELKSILPERRTEIVSGKKIGLIHGFGAPFSLPERVYRKFDEKPDVIVFGHSHDPYHRKIEGTLLFNPGSLAGSVFSQKGSYGILNIEDEVWGEVVYI